jgi:hypothetical protein
MQGQAAFAGAHYGLAYAPGQMDIGGPNHYGSAGLFDVHYPVLGVVWVFPTFLAAGDVDQFLLVFSDEVSAQRHDAGRIIVLYAMASLTGGFVSGFGLASGPLPMAVMEYGAASRASGRFRKF